MNKIIVCAAICCSLALLSCDDGDSTIENFNFNTTSARSCAGVNNSHYLYYTQGNEVMMIEIPLEYLPNEITSENRPRIINITPNTRVVYKVYRNAVQNTDICNNFPTNNPIQEEWYATSGSIEIQTYVNRSVNEITGEIRITGFTHLVRLIQTTFSSNNGTDLLFEELQFGEYNTAAEGINIPNNAPLQTCGSNQNYLFKNSNNQALILEIDESNYERSTSQLNNAISVEIDQELNKLKFSTFSDIFNSNTFFCNNSSPNTLNPIQEWNAQLSTTNNNYIELITTEETNLNNQIEYVHNFYLINTHFERNGVVFNLGNRYHLGSIRRLQ